jgi:hypothetical protein
VSGTKIVYASRPDATREAELNALCAVYVYLLNKRAAEPVLEPDSCYVLKRSVNKERRPA